MYLDILSRCSLSFANQGIVLKKGTTFVRNSSWDVYKKDSKRRLKQIFKKYFVKQSKYVKNTYKLNKNRDSYFSCTLAFNELK